MARPAKSKQDKSKKSKPADSPLLDYARLLRLPNVFTAMADVAMGFLFVHPIWNAGNVDWDDAAVLLHRGVFPLLVLASSLLYLAGMVLNDVFDIEVDRKERPERPLPSGRIPLATATRLGYGMLGGGVVLAALTGLLSPWSGTLVWRTGLIAALLAGCVYAYDSTLKKTSFGPLTMGACRLLNVLLGMSVAGGESLGSVFTLGYTHAQLLAAAGIGVYISGVTLFARDEAQASRRVQLGAALIVMVAGIVLLGLFPQYLDTSWLATEWWLANSNVQRGQMISTFWPMVLAILSISIVRRCSFAVYSPDPNRVQTAVKGAIVSLIYFDAAVAFLMSGPVAAIGILFLLVPTLLLGRWVYST
jgi:4-hydroxybenzoate polyprenyltransferase